MTIEKKQRTDAEYPLKTFTKFYTLITNLLMLKFSIEKKKMYDSFFAFL